MGFQYDSITRFNWLKYVHSLITKFFVFILASSGSADSLGVEPIYIYIYQDRWIHPGSGRVYNLIFNPPKVQGKVSLNFFLNYFIYYMEDLFLLSDLNKLCT